jgi:hypothetical protein
MAELRKFVGSLLGLLLLVPASLARALEILSDQRSVTYQLCEFGSPLRTRCAERVTQYAQGSAFDVDPQIPFGLTQQSSRILELGFTGTLVAGAALNDVVPYQGAGFTESVFDVTFSLKEVTAFRLDAHSVVGIDFSALGPPCCLGGTASIHLGSLGGSPILDEAVFAADVSDAFKHIDIERKLELGPGSYQLRLLTRADLGEQAAQYARWSFSFEQVPEPPMSEASTAVALLVLARRMLSRARPRPRGGPSRRPDARDSRRSRRGCP